MNTNMAIVFAAAVFGAAVLGSALSLPSWRRVCWRIGLMDEPGHRKIHAQPVPLAGGWAMLTGLFTALILLAGATWLGAGGPGWADALTQRLQTESGRLAAILGGGLGMALLGGWDDRMELRAGLKFAGQLLIGLIVIGTGLRLPLPVGGPGLEWGLTLLWVLAVTNAFNFMDNMNGLCAGLGIIAALAIGTIAMMRMEPLVAMLAFALGGAGLGFLPYNYPRASAFLGDTGSHLTGFLVAALALLPYAHAGSPGSPRAPAAFGFLWIAAVPLADLVWVVLLRWRSGRPAHIGDTNHLSHRLVRIGLRPAAAVGAIWALAALTGAVAVALAWCQRQA